VHAVRAVQVPVAPQVDSRGGDAAEPGAAATTGCSAASRRATPTTSLSTGGAGARTGVPLVRDLIPSCCWWHADDPIV